MAPNSAAGMVIKEINFVVKQLCEIFHEVGFYPLWDSAIKADPLPHFSTYYIPIKGAGTMNACCSSRL